jgi:hypothetical protein
MRFEIGGLFLSLDFLKLIFEMLAPLLLSYLGNLELNPLLKLVLNLTLNLVIKWVLISMNLVSTCEITSSLEPSYE